VIARFKRGGSPDRSFADGGTWKSKPSDPGTGQMLNTLALQHSGRILAAGTIRGGFLIRRLLADGSRDDSFSGDGRQTTQFPLGPATVNALGVRSEGRLLAVDTRTAEVGRTSYPSLVAAGYLLR
jgi:hypothetical protein